MNKAYIDDVGTKIYIDMGIDLSDFEELKAIVKKPKATGGYETVEWGFEVLPENTKIMKHTISRGELDAAGAYRIQPWGKKADWEGSGRPVTFYVFKKI